MARIGAVVGLAVIALLFVGLWWIPTHGLPAAAEHLPISVDRSIGDAAIRGMSDDLGPEIHTPSTDAALREIVGRLAPQARIQGFAYRWRVVRRPELNAFALPGGQIVVFEGLLRRATRADQVAGVLGHEISHVTLRHGIRAVARSAGVSIAMRVLLGDASALVDVAGRIGASAIVNSYSRDQESDADAEGARMVAAAGLDPRGLEEFFQMLSHEPGTQMPGMLQWMSTHPGHNDRIAALERLIPSLPRGPQVPVATPWANVQAELNALGPIPAH
jgi:predicted Zn-dependent protease